MILIDLAKCYARYNASKYLIDVFYDLGAAVTVINTILLPTQIETDNEFSLK